MPQPRKYESDAHKQAAYRKRQAAAYQEQLRSKGLPPLPTPAQIPGRVRWRSAIERACGLLEQTATEMREYSEERSERWQETLQAETFAEQLEAVESVLEDLRTLDV